MGKFGLIIRTVVLIISICITAPNFAISQTFNGGHGPVSIRGMFPPTLPYLNFIPEQPLTLREKGFRFDYQYSLANTHVNTESPIRRKDPDEDPIEKADVQAGLTEADFPATGYGAYIDVESERHKFSFHYGWWDDLELGLVLAWVSYGGRNMDAFIDSVEKAGNSVNETRIYADRDQFDYYLIHNGEFIYQTSTPFSYLPQEPVITFKYNLGQGGRFLPALSLKFSYKVPLNSDQGEPRVYVASGKADYGLDLMLAKRIARIVAYFQVGEAWLNVPEEHLAPSRSFRMFAIEYPVFDLDSLIFQLVSQTSLFRQSGETVGSLDYRMSRPSELLTVAYKMQGDGYLFNAGIVEDLNKNQNGIDVVFFMEVGWLW